MKPSAQKKVSNPLEEIKKIEQKRQERRLKMQEAKRQKQEKKAYNMASGKNVDIDFELMIQKSKFKQKLLSPHASSVDAKLSVCVRKRPIFKKEQANGEIDSISCANPQIKIHQPKYKVDGITKYVENHTFTFDNTFNQEQTTEDIYKTTLKPLVQSLVKNGIVTCFAYGQTGSGKTFTMNGMQTQVVTQLFDLTKKNFKVFVSFFEIYGGRCLDLLNQKTVLNILQDKSNSIQIPGLTQKSSLNAKQLLQTMEAANNLRTTHATVANDTSSRSHAICQIIVKNAKEDQVGKLVLVDLAGSQRAQDTQSNNRQRRMEGAQINKSLLALKECIRAMDQKADHVPFRASKLTLILRDSFLQKANNSKIIMLACISPGSSSADHSLNTLRYADRLKDNEQIHQKFNEMVENSKKNSSPEDLNIAIKEKIQKIESNKNIKKQQTNQQPKPPQNIKASIPPNKIPPKIANKKQETKKEEFKERQPPQPIPQIQKQDRKNDRSISVKKNMSLKQNKSTNPSQSKKSEPKEILEEIEVEDPVKQQSKRKVKDDVNAMKRTMKNQNKQQYFAFQEKVTNILEEQQEVFATHMAAIKQDAKLLTQESQLISTVQGVGFIDYDIDSYVQKLEGVIKKKLRMYNLLSKKVENFKKYLKEEDEMRLKVKDTFYY